jgi:hypothetical protein
MPVPLANFARIMTFLSSNGSGVVQAQVFVPTWWSINTMAVSSTLKVGIRGVIPGLFPRLLKAILALAERFRGL